MRRMLAFIFQALTTLSSLQSGLDLATPWCGLEIRAVSSRRGTVMLRNTCGQPDTLTDLYLRWAGASYNLGAKGLGAFTIPAKSCITITDLPLQHGDGAAAGVAVFGKYDNALTDQPVVAVTWGKDNFYGIWGHGGTETPDLPPLGPWVGVWRSGKWASESEWPSCW